MHLDTLKTKLKHSNNHLQINGFNANQWALIFKQNLKNENDFKKNLFLFNTEHEAESFFEQIKIEKNTYYFSELGADPYSSMIPSEYNLVKRLSIILNILKNPDSCNIVSTYASAHLWLPSRKFFESKEFCIEVSDIISPEELSKKLLALGLKRMPTTEEPGTYSNKGEIFDIYPIDHKPIRIIYFDDMIEEIFEIDEDTLITKRDKPLEKVNIGKTQFSFLTKEYINEFRSQLPRPNLQDREKFLYREQILKKLSKNEFFDDYPLFLKYFFNEPTCLFDYTNHFNIQIFNSHDTEDGYLHFKQNLTEQYEIYDRNIGDIIKPAPDNIYNFNINTSELNPLYINSLKVSYNLDESFENEVNINKTEISDLLKKYSKQDLPKTKKLIQLIAEFKLKKIPIILYYSSDTSRKEIEYNLNTYSDSHELSAYLNFINDTLDSGFYYETEGILILSENDFFEKKTKKAKRQKNNINQDVFAEQLATLAIGDYVIHKDHGLGKYLGVETLELSGSTSDFIVIEYKDSDKVYVPVYKLSLVQKHATSDHKLTVANLKTKKFDQAKEKARNAVKKLAFDLLELQAKRKLKKGFVYSEPDHLYQEFSLNFKFQETPDQLDAIESVIEDMTSEKPMDRLVCGDVGFGKTEVAMRAAFKAVEDKKQVAILVPTTVLTFQHFNSFIERFKNFPINIEYVSRFKTTKQVNEILQKVASGGVDILIGTHKILSSKVKFKDLGLLIIDEEQRFGVGHKEKLKLLKENLDTLTLTATPIPRTLQMSFLGIKDLSVIKTPPPRRQSIKSYIIKEDPHTLKLAIEKELSRGGQVFIVHNRVHDIELFTENIRKLVPSARIIFAHGQLPERDLEKRISEFYNYKYDILISTTIIESGIDIPRANTMIVDRADTYGLSQLHQLRGRIGRSDKKAYAYFIIPDNKSLSEVAGKRLRALQTYADLGSGFSLATSDLEIRGSGDILGPEQSGHIGTIGLELYMELLEECIRELKGQSFSPKKDIEIITPFNSYIPNSYMDNSGLRLKFYKRISSANDENTLKEIEYELIDQYGKLPDEVQNLLYVIKARLNLSGLGISAVKVKSQSILLSFASDFLDQNTQLKDKIINFFMQRPKIYKINPDYSINCQFKDKINVMTFLDFTKHISDQF